MFDLLLIIFLYFLSSGIYSFDYSIMSNGATFIVMSNDGKQDRLLFATAYLNARMKKVSAYRASRGMDPTPTLSDIEKTHVLLVNAHFKPVAAMGYEYNKVRPTTGSVSLNSPVEWQLPQFGDFYHDAAAHVRLNKLSSDNDAYTYRWCSYPGERLFNSVKFAVASNTLDQYYSNDVNNHRQFFLPANKKAGWDRCMGQQESYAAQVIPNVGTTLSTGNDAAGVGSTLTKAFDGSNALWVNVTDGYQTVKSHTAHVASESVVVQRTDILEVTIPILLWFCVDPRLSLAAVSLPGNQRRLTAELCDLTDLVRGVVVAGSDGSTNSVAASLSIANGTDIAVAELYLNNIFMNPEIHDIFIRRVGFNLIRVHRRQVRQILDAASEDILLNDLKWPIEYICFGVKHNSNSTSASSLNYLDGWHMYARADALGTDVDIPSAVGGTPGTATLTAQYVKFMPVIQKVTFKAHGVPIYNDMPAILFNQYLPLVRGEKLCTPTDPGAYIVTFCLYPGVYQPSGHVNVSRTREFYIAFSNSITDDKERNLGTAVASDAAAHLYASGGAINFLLLTDSSAVLRYTT